MIYGLFVLLASLGSLFFLFNTGQLSAEKTKLVNTADAVAYSAGVMHARALNFNSYTNRAMIADEILVAQMVSTISWARYIDQHASNAPTLLCNTYYNIPFGLLMLKYTPLCMGLAYPGARNLIKTTEQVVEIAGRTAVGLSEAAKLNLQLAQSTMFVTLVAGRHDLLQQVADANYKNDGVVKVDDALTQALFTDDLLRFDGGPFISLYTGNDRTRFRNFEVQTAMKDGFVQNRAWSDSTFPSLGCFVQPQGSANRTGSTTMNGFTEWRATDRATFTKRSWHWSLFSSGCKTDISRTMGSATVRARQNAGGNDLPYSGVPNYYELSAKALTYTPENQDTSKRDPRLRFAIRLTRANTEAKTSMGKSQIKPTGELNIFQGKEAKNVMAAVATSEVFFERSKRENGKTELASLFNPFWQVHLVGNSTADVAAAIALQATP